MIARCALLALSLFVFVEASKSDICRQFAGLDADQPFRLLSQRESTNGISVRTWESGINPRFSNTTVGEFVALLGNRELGNGVSHNTAAILQNNSPVKFSESTLPVSFDARERWPDCGVITAISNQGECGACYYFATAGALGIAHCAVTEGKVDVILSEEHLISCDGGDDPCSGGYLYTAWIDLVNSGTVSSSCVPYVGEKESCLAGQCRGESLPVSYLASTWAILNSTTEMMQAISQYGSITTFFTVFSDFGSYVSGVYKCDPDASNYLGHAVQLIGWGTDSDSNIDYWIGKNSWGRGWGENGFFRVSRNILVQHWGHLSVMPVVPVGVAWGMLLMRVRKQGEDCGITLKSRKYSVLMSPLVGVPKTNLIDDLGESRLQPIVTWGSFASVLALLLLLSLLTLSKEMRRFPFTRVLPLPLALFLLSLGRLVWQLSPYKYFRSNPTACRVQALATVFAQLLGASSFAALALSTSRHALCGSHPLNPIALFLYWILTVGVVVVAMVVLVIQGDTVPFEYSCFLASMDTQTCYFYSLLWCFLFVGAGAGVILLSSPKLFHRAFVGLGLVLICGNEIVNCIRRQPKQISPPGPGVKSRDWILARLRIFLLCFSLTYVPQFFLAAAAVGGISVGSDAFDWVLVDRVASSLQGVVATVLFLALLEVLPFLASSWKRKWRYNAEEVLRESDTRPLLGSDDPKGELFYDRWPRYEY